MVRRLGWGIADQALSSLTNFALGLIVARNVDTAALGAFAFAFLAYACGLGVNRATAAQPLVIRYSATTPSRWASGVAVAGGVALIVGLLSALIAGAIALSTSGALREAFLAMAIVFPGLLYQDTWRYAFFAEGRATSACLNDLVWAVVMIPALWASIQFWPGSIGGPVLAWGGAATIAGAFGLVQSHIWPRPWDSRSWLRDHWDLIPRFVGEFATSMVASALSLVALGAIAGLTAAGTLRAGTILLGPLNILYQGVGLVAVPEGVALLKRSERALQRFWVVLAVTLALVATAWGVMIVLIPPSVGTLILGSNWAVAGRVVVPLALSLAGEGICYAARVPLRALGAARHSFRANAVQSVLVLGTGLVGVTLAGATGAAWGYAVGNWTGATAWWLSVRSAFRERRVSGEPIVAAPEPARDVDAGGDLWV